VVTRTKFDAFKKSVIKDAALKIMERKVMVREEIIQVKEVVLEPCEYEVLKIIIKEFASGAEGFGIPKEKMEEQLEELIPLVSYDDLAQIEKEIGLAPGVLTTRRAMAIEKILNRVSGSINVFKVNKE
jgi:hypothetical protein